MVLFGEKRPRRILAGYLVLGIMGALTFSSMTEFLDLSEIEVKRAVSDGLLAPTEITIDWLSESAAIISKDEGYSSSSLRARTLRVSALPSIQNTGILIVRSTLKTIKKTQYPDIKNSILLKLRI
jgi:hypothetical protein